MTSTPPDGSKSGEGSSGDDEYDKKFQELQKYIPFLKGMMRKLEHSSDKLRAAQLKKMKNLYSLLTNPQKRLKLETLEKCEDVLNKLQEKLKSCFGPGRSSGRLENFDSDQDCLPSTSQAHFSFEEQSAHGSESKNMPFFCDSGSKSTLNDYSSAGTSAIPSTSYEERPKIDSSSREKDIACRFIDNDRSDPTVNINQVRVTREPVRRGEVIPCLESPSSPTNMELVASTPPVCIPLERKEPLSESREPLQESRERLKKIMTQPLQESRERLKKIMTTQPPLINLPKRGDSFTQPSFTVCRTPAPEEQTDLQDHMLGPSERPPVSSLPFAGSAESRIGFSGPPERSPVFYSHYTGSNEPRMGFPGPPERPSVSSSPYIGSSEPRMGFPGPPERPSVSSSPYIGSNEPRMGFHGPPERPLVSSSPYTSSTESRLGFPGPSERPPVSSSPYTGSTESRTGYPTPLPTPSCARDRVGTPARSEIDPDFPFLQKNASYLPVNKDPEFPYLKKCESYLSPAASSSAVNNCDAINRPSSLSLRAKLGQDIDTLHKVGVSSGGALRTLIHKDDRKSLDKKEDDGEKEKADEQQPVVGNGKRHDQKRSSIESHPNLGSIPNRVDRGRSSVSSMESAADEGERHSHSNLGLLPRNEMGLQRVDSQNQRPNSCSPAEGGRNLVRPHLINDRSPPVPLLELPPANPILSPRFSEPKSNPLLSDPYPPAKPDFYSRSQNNQRSHVVCSTPPFAQSRPPPSRFQTQNKVLLPTPISRLSSPWINAGSGGPRQTSAHQLGLRYSQRPNTGHYSAEEPQSEPNTPRQAAGFQQGRPLESRNTLPGKDAFPALFTPDPQTRLSETSSPNVSNRREFNSDVKARGCKDSAQEKFRNTDTKKREEKDEKHGQERNKGRDKNKETGEKSHGKGKQDKFSSPLGSLYENIPQPKTGKGYGIQTFRIPKKKADPPRTESKPSASSHSPPNTGNKIPVLENKAPIPLKSPPMTGKMIPILERRMSPLKDPRTVRGKSRPPSPFMDSPIPGTPPVWGVDTSVVRGTPVSAELPFKSQSMGANQAERLPAGNQSRPFHESDFDSSPTEDSSNQLRRRSSRSPVDRLSRGRSRPYSPDRRSRARSRAGSRSPYRSKSRGRSPWNDTRRSRERSKSRAHSRPRSRTPERSKSRARSRPRSQTPERSKSRARSRPRSRTPERSKSRARSRPRSRTPERSKSRARSRPRSRTPERSKSRARSRPRSRTPERSKSRARSRPRSQTPERSKSRARSRPRSKTPEKSKSRARSRSRSKTPERSKSRASSRPRSRTPDRSRPRTRVKEASRSPERKNSGSSRRNSRGRARLRSKSRGRSLSAASETLSSAPPDTASTSPERKARSGSRDRSISERSASQDSHRTTDSGSYSNRSRHRDRSSDRDLVRNRRSYRRSRRRSRSRSRTRGSSRDRRRRSGRGRSKSSSPHRRSLSRSRRSLRDRKRSRSKSPSREIERVSNIKPPQSEVSSESQSSPTRATRTEPDVSSTSDAQPVGAKSIPDLDSKEVTSAQSAEKAKIATSNQFASEPPKPAEKVEDKLAALKDLLGNPEVMKFLVEKNILNLSAVGNLSSVQSDINQSSNTEPCDSANSTPTSSAPANTSVGAPKIAAEDASRITAVVETSVTADVRTAETSKISNDPEDSQTSVSAGYTGCADETPLCALVKVPKATRRSKKKQTTKKTKRGGSTSSAGDEWSVERKFQKITEKQPQAPQPRRRNELEKLQEDIREMFDSAEVVNATGHRTCRVRREAQEQGPKSRNSSSEKNRTDSDMDLRSRPRSREDESSKVLNTSSESGHSVGTDGTGVLVDVDPGHQAESEDDDTPLHILQRSMDVRSPTVSESSPIRPTSKKRKYNLIDSETESEVDDGRVSSCSVVIENIAPFTLSKDGALQRASSRNMARRGKKTGFSNFGNRRIPPEELKPVVEENLEDVDKSLIDYNNIIVWPDGEEHGKLTRRQLKMRLTEQDVELTKPSISNSDSSSLQSVNRLDSKVAPPSSSKQETTTRTETAIALDNNAVTPSLSKSVPPPNKNLTEATSLAVREKSAALEQDQPVQPSSSPVTHKSSERENTKPVGLQDVLPATFIKFQSDAGDVRESSALTQVACLVRNFVFSNTVVTCRHCPWKGKLIVSHYKCSHPEAEIDYSRFPVDVASKLYADSEKEGFTDMSEQQLAAKFPLSRQRARFFLRCILCKTMLNPARFAKHFSLHTGEYHFRCGLCSYTAPSKDWVSEHFKNVHFEGKKAHIEHVVHVNIAPLNVVLVYSCSLCNYFQLHKRSIENHIKSVHATAENCFIKRVAVSELIDRQALKVEPNNTNVATQPGVPATTEVAAERDDATKTQEITPEAPKENEPQAEILKDVAPVENLSEFPLPDTAQTQSESMETTSVFHPDKEAASHPDQESVSRPDQEESHPEVPVSDGSSQPEEMRTAVTASPVATTAPDPESDKDIDLSVFISSDPLKSQEQQIEEERLKMLKDAEDTLRNRPFKPRSSILDLISERINAPQDSSAASSVENIPHGLSPLPSLRATPARRANKSLMSMTSQTSAPTDSERKVIRQHLAKSQENLDVALPSSAPSLLPGELNSTVELMRKKIESPIIARNKSTAYVHQFRISTVVDESITVATVFKMKDPSLPSVRVGDVEVRRGSDEGALYVCHGDKCIFTSSLPKLYVEHLATEHHRWRVRQVCSACRHELDEQGDMVYAFNHIRSLHLVQEFPSERPQPARRLPPTIPLVRARRLPGDKLSIPGNSLALKKAPKEIVPSQPEQSHSEPPQSEPPLSEPPQSEPPQLAPPPEGETVLFCRIENVISLSSIAPPVVPPSVAAPPVVAPADEHEQVDVETIQEEGSITPLFGQRPVPPAAPLSPQTLAVQTISIEKTPDSRRCSADELGPTSLAQLNPVQMNTPRTIGKVSFQKEKSVADEMHTKEKLRHFFKCTGRRCSYSTNIKANFVYHYTMHVAKESESGSSNCKFEWNKCIYCGTEESSGGRLTEHMIQFHGECYFQCAYCLYRAAYQANVVFHQNISHSNDPMVVLECRRVAESPQIPKPVQNIDFYQCAQAPIVCREEFFFTEDFKQHLRAKHSDDKFRCATCQTEFGSPEHLVLHYNVQHAVRTYHCLYCRKAAETQKEMSHHLCYDHPEEAIIVAARVRTGVSQGPTMERAEFDPNRKIHTIRLDDERSNAPEYLSKLPPLTGGSITVPSEETDDPKQEVAFDNVIKPPPSKEIIVISDDDPVTVSLGCDKAFSVLQNTYKVSPACMGALKRIPEPPKIDPQSSEPKKNEERVLSADELVAKVQKEIENTGLVGRALYRCGHTDCSYTADSMAQLKDHMYVCDFSRNSPALVCVHCTRVAKTVDAFIEHLRSHGLHRYSCGSCDVRAATLNLITHHMKKTHYFTEYNVVPLHPLQKDPDVSLFTVYAKDVAVGKRRTKKVSKTVYYPVKAILTHDAPATDKFVFSPDEINLLPHSAVFTKEYRCSICNYSNKVRCNLVRHLQQHAAGREASPTPVVNPVPHLERNNGEKMFDTMMNHAVSSNLPRRDSTTSAKELEELPKFVPEQSRYACSVCPSVTSEDTLYLHLTTLHPELKEVGYHCPHCRERSIQVIPLDRNMIPHHLKMHDNTLYKCPYCNFHHYQRHHVQRHTQDKHSDQQQYYKSVREPESKATSQPASEGSSEQSGQESADSEGVAKEHQVVVFECGICGWEGPRPDVLNHVRTVHKMYNSLKCTACDYGTNIRKNFARHFREKHDGLPQQVISILKKVVKFGSAAPRTGQEKRLKELPTPSWQLQKGHAKHVRGIMFEENGPKPRELEHGDFGEISTGKRSYSNDHRDGPDPKKMYVFPSSKAMSMPRDEPLEKYRCPKCCSVFEMTESQFRIHLLEESESSSWLCHLCNKASENFSCLVKHYANEHGIADELSVMKNGLYDTKVTDSVNRMITKHQKAKAKEAQAQDAGTSRVTRTSRSLASSPVAWTAGSSESSSDSPGVHCPKKPKLTPSTPIKILPAPSLASPPRTAPSPAVLTPTTLKKIMVVKPMSLPGTSKSEDLDPENLETNIEEVEEDSRSNDEWERFEKPAEQPCTHCKTTYPSQDELKKHIQLVHGSASPVRLSQSAVNANRPYTCDHCDYTCKSRVEKRNHEMRHWLHKPFKCGHCDSQFVRESEVRKHLNKTHPGQIPVILENEKSSSEQAFLPLQRKRKSDKGPPSAEKSEQRCPDTPDTKSSESTSVSAEDYSHVFYPSVYKCAHCPRRGTSLDHLKIHIESNHRAEYVADFVFKYEKLEFSEVVNSRRPYKFRCGMCQTNGTLVGLCEHYQIYHSDNPIALRGCTEKVFQCGLCICYYPALSYLSRHFEKRHPEEAVKFEKRTIDPDLETRQYKCLWCNEVMGSLQALAKHHDCFHSHLKASYKEMDINIGKSKAVALPSVGERKIKEEADTGLGSSSGAGEKFFNVKVRAVARKSTSKVRSVARKSTSTPARACTSNADFMNVDTSNEESDNDVGETREGTSFYGRPTSPVDVKRVTCPIQCGPVVRRVNVATAAQAMDLHPVVVCVDISDDSPPNNQPCDSSNTV